MTTTVKQYEVFCTVETDYFKVWSDSLPTVCPNNNAHAIDSNLTGIIQTISTNIIQAEEATNGYFETSTVSIDIPSGTPGTITEHDVSWQYNLTLWNTNITPTTPIIDDSFSVLAAPETTIGVLTAPASIGETVINVDSGTFANMFGGFRLILDDTVNKDVFQRVIGIDSGAGTVTLSSPLTFNFAAGTPVKISVYVIDNLYIADTNTIQIGHKGFKGKSIPAGMILRVYYQNNSGTAKTIRFRIEVYNLGV